MKLHQPELPATEVVNVGFLVANNSYQGIVHLVGEQNDGGLTRAACGARPKGGWHPDNWPGSRRITCQSCVRRIQRLFARKGTTPMEPTP